MERATKIRAANSLLKTNDVVQAVLSRVVFDTVVNRKSDDENECVRFVFLAKASNDKDVEMSVMTGIVLNKEPVLIKNKDRGKKNQKIKYNRFTTMCLKLNIIQTNDLENIDDLLLSKVEVALEKINNLPCTFKTVKSKEGFNNVDVESLKLLS